MNLHESVEECTRLEKLIVECKNTITQLEKDIIKEVCCAIDAINTELKRPSGNYYTLGLITEYDEFYYSSYYLFLFMKGSSWTMNECKWWNREKRNWSLSRTDCTVLDMGRDLDLIINNVKTLSRETDIEEIIE